MKFLRLTSATVGAAILALLLVSPVKVSAESENNPKQDIQEGNGFCGADVPELPVIGFVNYHRTGDTIAIQYHIEKGRPNEDYRIQVWGDFCTFFGELGTIRTNKNGVANFNGTIEVPETTTRIFATAWNDNSFWNDTPAVDLP